MPALSNKKNPEPRDERFDWEMFLDGRQRTCRYGVDFDGEPKTFQSRARQAAKRRARRAITWREHDDVVIQFVPLKRRPKTTKRK